MLSSVLLWALPWFWVPGEATVAALLAVTLAAAWRCLRQGGSVALLAGALALGTAGFLVLDTVVLERDAVRLTRRAPQPAAAPERLRLVDFNVLHGYDDFPRQEERAARSIAALVALRPDVLVLQEAWRTRRHGDFVERLAAELGMDAAYARANGRLERIGFEEGEAILSRFPIVSARRLALAPRKPFFERRVALVCVLDLGGGETLDVVGVHLDHQRPAVAAAQARHLAARVAAPALPIVAGDLNAGSDDEAVRALVARGWRDVVPGGIDHVLMPEGLGWAVRRAEWTLRPEDVARLTGELYALSDHPGIVLDLARPRGVAAPRDVR